MDVGKHGGQKKGKVKGEMGTPSSAIVSGRKRKGSVPKKRSPKGLGERPSLKKIPQIRSPEDKKSLFMREAGNELDATERKFVRCMESAVSQINDIKENKATINAEQLKSSAFSAAKSFHQARTALSKIDGNIFEASALKNKTLPKITLNLKRVNEALNYPKERRTANVGKLVKEVFVLTESAVEETSVALNLSVAAVKESSETNMDTTMNQDEGIGNVSVEKTKEGQKRPGKMKSGKVDHMPNKANIGTFRKLPKSYMGGETVEVKKMMEVIKDFEKVVGRRLNVDLSEAPIEEEALAAPKKKGDGIDEWMSHYGFSRHHNGISNSLIRKYKRDGDVLTVRVQMSDPRLGHRGTITNFEGNLRGKAVSGHDADALFNIFSELGIDENAMAGATASGSIAAMPSAQKKRFDESRTNKRILRKAKQVLIGFSNELQKMIIDQTKGIPPEDGLDETLRNIRRTSRALQTVERNHPKIFQHLNRVEEFLSFGNYSLKDAGSQMATAITEIAYAMQDPEYGRDTSVNRLNEYISVRDRHQFIDFDKEMERMFGLKKLQGSGHNRKYSFTRKSSGFPTRITYDIVSLTLEPNHKTGVADISMYVIQMGDSDKVISNANHHDSPRFTNYAKKRLMKLFSNPDKKRKPKYPFPFLSNN